MKRMLLLPLIAVTLAGCGDFVDEDGNILSEGGIEPDVVARFPLIESRNSPSIPAPPMSTGTM